jgi:hypothetical protein
MATQFQKFKQQLDKDYIKKNRTPNWIEYPKLKEHWMSFVEYKKSENFAKASARGKKSRGKKEHDHHLGQGGYAFEVPKWQKMEEDLLAQGTIPTFYDWPVRVKNWYYAHGGTINSEDGSLDYPPSLREAALEILKTTEDVRAGRVKVDREMDELTMALKNPEHPGRCRGYGVVPWKFAFRRDIATYRSRRRRREREGEEWWQEIEKRLKEHEEKVTTDIEQRVVAALNEMAPSRGLPLVQVPSAHKSSCASTVVPEEQREIEKVQVNSQRYPVDDICRRTTCELHKPFGNIKMKVCIIHAFIGSIIDA